MVYCMVGTPLGGKTTFSKALSEKFGYDYFSTGDLFRKLAKDQEEDLSKDLSFNFDDVIRTKVIQKCKESENLVLDGFPRSANQIIDLLVEDITFKVAFVYVNPVEMYRRAVGRQRNSADAREIVAKRAESSREFFNVLKSLVPDRVLFWESGEDSLEVLEKWCAD